jgi:heme exporter protein D
MNWTSWSDFVAMGGYGLYVWGSFGMVALVMAGEVLQIGAARRALAGAERQDQPGELSNEI